MPTCQNCGNKFPNKIKINNHIYNLSGRKFCLECSPLGTRNTRSYIVELKQNEAFCVRCAQIKNKNEFYKRKDSGKPFSYCIECQKNIKEIKFQEKLERIVEERNGCCANCGGCFPIPLYEFYSDKGCYQISKTKHMSLEKMREKLKDYVMLCLNCSAIRKWENS